MLVALNTGKTKYMVANAHIKTGSNFYEIVKSVKYLGSLVTNTNSIQEEIKCRLKAGNSCYYSVQTLLTSRLLSKNLKIKRQTMILSIVPWSLTLREERRLRILKAGSLGKYLGSRGMRIRSGEGSTMRNYIVCTVRLI